VSSSLTPSYQNETAQAFCITSTNGLSKDLAHYSKGTESMEVIPGLKTLLIFMGYVIKNDEVEFNLIPLDLY